jgi:hypothetical protein
VITVVLVATVDRGVRFTAVPVELSGDSGGARWGVLARVVVVVQHVTASAVTTTTMAMIRDRRWVVAELGADLHMSERMVGSFGRAAVTQAGIE